MVVRIEDEDTIVVRVIVRRQARAAVALAAGGDRSMLEGIDIGAECCINAMCTSLDGAGCRPSKNCGRAGLPHPTQPGNSITTPMPSGGASAVMYKAWCFAASLSGKPI